MNILVVTGEFPSSWQPQRASFNRQHLNALAAHHRLEIICPIPWQERLRRRRPGPPVAPVTIDEGIRVSYPTYWYPPGMLRASYDQWLWLSLRGVLRATAARFKPDVVLGIWAFPDGAVAVQLARDLGIPAAVQCLGSDINLLDGYPGRKRKTLEALDQAARVITVSKALRSRLVDYGLDGERIEVVYRGVNADAFAPMDQQQARERLGLPLDRQLVLYAGNLVPVKAPDVLFSSFAAARFRRPVELHLLGDGPLRAGLEKSAAALAPDRRAVFHGVVPHADLPLWLSAADLLVLPSRAEGVPNILLEAGASGCPYVATRVGGIPEISDHAGALLVDSGDVGGLRGALESVLNAETGERRPVSWYPWDEAGAALAAAIEKALG